MAVTVPPIPYKTPFLRADGFLNEPWAKWLRDVFVRIGGIEALSNTELAGLNSSDIDSIQEDIEALQSAVDALEESTGIGGGLNQGRAL